MAKIRYEINEPHFPVSELLRKLIQSKNPDMLTDEGGFVLSFDPGETTGVAAMQNGKLLMYGQIPTKTISTDVLMSVTGLIKKYPILRYNPKAVVTVEDYKVYEWKKDQHSWAGLHTPQFIGMIKTACALHLQKDPVMRMAQHVKGFFTDDKLKKMNLYCPGMPHARDAIRHACYQSVFKKLGET